MILVLFLIVFIGILEINVGVILNRTGNTTLSNENITIEAVNIDEYEVQTKFKEIKDIPYNEHSMNCKNKSEMFAEYLIMMGELMFILLPFPTPLADIPTSLLNGMDTTMILATLG